MGHLSVFFISLFLFFAYAKAIQLGVSGTDLVYNGKKVFLSGTNIAWNSYGYDFGNNGYMNNGQKLEEWLEMVKQNGGNSVSK